MLVRTRGKGGGSRLRRSLAVAVASHALALAIIGVGIGGPRPIRVGARDGAGVAGATADIATPLDVTALDTAVAADLVPVAEVPPEDLGLVPAADRTNPVLQSSPRAPDGVDTRRAPAPDRGAGAGMPLPDPAWRRDASTLHERLTDGAEVNQPSRARTARWAASPEAVRREPRTGLGDATRTTQALPKATAGRYGVVDPQAAGSGDETVPGAGLAADQVPMAAVIPVRPVVEKAESSSEGPLDSERGTRSYDTEARGGVAGDDRSARAASKERYPSITDLTLASVSGNSGEGRGPSDTPGAVSRPARGATPTPAGARVASDGAGEEARTRERAKNRYMQEIRSRVNQALIWPRALAIRLEQGETVLRFVVLPDGTVTTGVQIVKSSGFAEFDRAALDAVRKASPFSPMRDAAHAGALVVNLPVTFSNPVIR